MLNQDQRRAWAEDGFFILRGFAEPGVGAEMERQMVQASHRDPPAAHAGEPAYESAGELIIMPEARIDPDATRAEDRISKVFNPHLAGAAADFARDARVADVVEGVLGPDIVFQSQFIFKNRGAWGQPWHQDSFYFPFERAPQVGVWLAISDATMENGCLSVLPGSHKAQTIHAHHPDARPGANQGYLEVLDQDTRAAVPVLMAPGDVLVFHSDLLHRSLDNRSGGRRSAMVYHYGQAGTRAVAELNAGQRRILRWTPVRRSAHVT